MDMGAVADAPRAGKILAVVLEADGVKAPGMDAIGVGNAIATKVRVRNASLVHAEPVGVAAKAVRTKTV